MLHIRDSEGLQLEEDNILGERTRSCIKKMPVLRFRSRGKAVEFVQKVLNSQPVDGDFGPITKQCVMEYQRNNNIDVDGIVGIQTWTYIVIT